VTERGTTAVSELTQVAPSSNQLPLASQVPATREGFSSLDTDMCVSNALAESAGPANTNVSYELVVSLLNPMNDILIGREWAKMSTILHEHKVDEDKARASMGATYVWYGTNAVIAYQLITNAVANGTIDAKKLDLEVELTRTANPTKPSYTPAPAFSKSQMAEMQLFRMTAGQDRMTSYTEVTAALETYAGIDIFADGWLDDDRRMIIEFLGRMPDDGGYIEHRKQMEAVLAREFKPRLGINVLTALAGPPDSRATSGESEYLTYWLTPDKNTYACFICFRGAYLADAGMTVVTTQQ